MKHKAISHCAFTIDDFRLPTLDHSQNPVLVNAGVNTLLSRGPRQYSYSALENTYFALGNVGTHRPSSNLVFQPQWST
jgi:hypothetical protein